MSPTAITINGNAFLEMLLFLPLGVLLLFVAVDAGFVYSEKAAIVNAIRSGVHSQVRLSAEHGLLVLNREFVLEQDERAAEQLLQQVLEHIRENVACSRRTANDEQDERFRIRAATVYLDIDPDTGQLSPSWRRNLGQALSAERGAFSINSVVPSYPYVSMEDFLTEKISNAEDAAAYSDSSGSVGRNPSPFAVPAGHEYRADIPSAKRKYLSKTALLYVEVTALTRGLAPMLTRSLLGRFYALEEQQMHLLRQQLS